LDKIHPQKSEKKKIENLKRPTHGENEKMNPGFSLADRFFLNELDSRFHCET
jgi:hypothetical protein